MSAVKNCSNFGCIFRKLWRGQPLLVGIAEISVSIWSDNRQLYNEKVTLFQIKSCLHYWVTNLYMFVLPAANHISLVLFLFTARVGCATMLLSLIIAIDN